MEAVRVRFSAEMTIAKTGTESSGQHGRNEPKKERNGEDTGGGGQWAVRKGGKKSFEDSPL